MSKKPGKRELRRIAWLEAAGRIDECDLEMFWGDLWHKLVDAEIDIEDLLTEIQQEVVQHLRAKGGSQS